MVKIKSMLSNKSTTKKSLWARCKGPIILVMAFPAIVLAILFILDAIWFAHCDESMKNKAATVFSRVVVPPVLQFESREYPYNSGWWDYAPKWIYHYELKADKKIVFNEVKQAFLEACGPNTPDAPYIVSWDEENNVDYVSAQNCDNVSIQYEPLDDKHATITLSPIEQAKCNDLGENFHSF